MSALLARRRAALLAASLCLLLVQPVCAAITTIGDVPIFEDNGNWGDTVYVAHTANGTMLVTGGSVFEIDTGLVGYGPDTIGLVAVDGEGSTWTNTAHYELSPPLALGYEGTGILNVTGGGSVRTSRADLGVGPSAVGVATITGPGSTLETDYQLSVGVKGTGTLAILGGGQVDDCQATLGYYPGSEGSVVVDGAGSTWTTDYMLQVGVAGTGTVNVTGGGTVSSRSECIIAAANDGTGAVTVDGTGSMLSIGDGLYVGSGGTGTLSITGGGTVESQERATIGGYSDEASGMVTVDGAGSTWTHAGTIEVGADSTGSFNVTGGASVDEVGLLGIALETGSTGHVRVEGEDSILNVDQYLWVGWAGIGDVAIADGATVRSKEAHVGKSTGSRGAVTVDGSHSTLATSHWLMVGYSGTGTLAVTGGGVVAGAPLDKEVQDDRWPPPTGGVTAGRCVGSSGEVTVDGPGSTLHCIYMFVGEEGTGTLSVTNGGRVRSGFLYVGGRGRYMGNGGTGALHIDSGGQVLTTRTQYDDICIGYSSTGTVTIDGEGSSWTVMGPLTLGGGGGHGTLHIAGGTVDLAQDVQLGYAFPLPESNEGTICLAGGLLRMHGGSILKAGGTATFDFTGGRLEGVGTIDLGGPLVQRGGTFAPGDPDWAGFSIIDGGYTLDRGTLEINLIPDIAPAWDMLSVSGTVDLVGDNGLADGMLSVILGFTPMLGDEFLIIDNHSTDPVFGFFANSFAAKSPFGDSLYRFAVDYTAGDGNDIALVAQSASLWGDYDGDGTVDARDYTFWHDAIGTRVAPYFGADGNGDGIVNEADYDVWKTHYGATASGAGLFNPKSTIRNCPPCPNRPVSPCSCWERWHCWRRAGDDSPRGQAGGLIRVTSVGRTRAGSPTIPTGRRPW